MPKLIQRLGERLATGPNRIALSTALRGTIATVTPLAVLPYVGLGDLAYPAVLGALNTSMVDVGGPYRSRLAGMALLATAGPCLQLLGAWIHGIWWLAAIVMFAVAFASGLVRVIGRGGASLGINTSLTFLVGLQVGESGLPVLGWAGGYFAGAVWTILVTLAFWQLRPYRRLEQEVATAWEAVADLVAAAVAGDDEPSVVARRRREQRLQTRHRSAREVVERAREALGAMRAGTVGPGTTLAQLLVLLNAAARIGAAAVTLGEIEARGDRDPAMRAARRAAGSELERACRAVARILLDGRGELALEAMRARLAELSERVAPRGGESTSAEALAFAQAMRHLENAEEALRFIFGQRHRLPHLLRLPFANRAPRGAALAALRAHLTPSSAVFRHAMRAAAIAAIDTGIILRFTLPHGIWLPLTSLVILQPDYGGTLTRALQRTVGTIAGAAVAGLLLAAVHGSWQYDVAIGLLLFLTFLLIRRRYGYGIVFLTPLVILLIGMQSPDPWIDLLDRIAYTVAGAGFAIAAGYVLWPQWERATLPDRLAGAIRADRDFLLAVLDGLAGAAVEERTQLSLRRQAEIALGNADAAFQRMQAEPTRQRAGIGGRFSLLIYCHRLCRHVISLSAHLGAVTAPREPIDALCRLMAAALDDLAEALRAGRPPAPRPAFDEPLARLRAALVGTDETVALLLGQIVSDATGLRSAAEPR